MYPLCLFLGLSYEYRKEGVVYISGRVHPQKILDLIGKHENKVELRWMKTGNQYVRGSSMPMSHYPPYHHHHEGYYPSQTPYIEYHDVNSYGPYHPELPFYY